MRNKFIYALSTLIIATPVQAKCDVVNQIVTP